jgi:Ca2+-binding EF-hand superfamily protein
VDQDRSGTVSQEELTSALEAGGERFNIYCVKMMIDMFDRRSNGTIDFLEFTYLFGYIKSMRDSFEGYDANRSGSLGVNEINQGMEEKALSLLVPYPLVIVTQDPDSLSFPSQLYSTQATDLPTLTPF